MAQFDFGFTGYNNVKIYGKKDTIDNPKANIVIVHGIFEHLDRYDYLVSKLNESGYDVYRYDARGHGRSGGKKGNLDSFDEYLLDLDDFISLVKRESDNLKTVLLGHSMGGLVATAYASTFPTKIDLLALSGACNKTPKSAKALAYIPTFITSLFKYKNKLGDGVCSDASVVEKYNNDPLVLKEGSLKLMKKVFINGCEYVNNNIDKVCVPTLIMHGESDGIVVYNTGKWTYDNLKIEDKTLKMYEGLYHEIFNEVKKDEVIEDLINWIDEKIGG